MLYPFYAYIKYFLRSRNQYGVHSPFVYDYITRGLMNHDLKPTETVNLYRKALLSNTTQIDVTDFGAGSRVFKGNRRVVSDIALKAGISGKRGASLSKTIRYFNPQNILEIGTSLGISTAYMASAGPETKICSLEGCPTIAGLAKNYFADFNFTNIEVVVGEFSQTLPSVLKNKKYDLIYFDGNHQKEPTLSYFIQCLDAAHENSVFIFDDIHWTSSMEEAWTTIKNHDQVSVTIDTFYWGMVFFRKGQAKQHFTLRI